MTGKKTIKYNLIEAAGKELFWKHGIARVNVDEICSAAGVSRMTFYKYFRNKTHLALVVLQTYYDDSIKRYSSIMSSEREFPDKVRELILLKIEGVHDFSKEFLNDILKDEGSELSAWYHKIYTDTIDLVIRDLGTAQKKGEIRKDLKLEFIMYIFDKTFEMARDQALLSHYNSVQEIVLEIVNFYFYGIMPHKNKVR